MAARRGQRAQRQAGVQAAAEAGCGTRPLAPVTDPLTIASKDARSRRIGSAPAETAPATRQNRKGRVLAATPTNPPKWKCNERCVADRTGHTAASVGRDAPKDNHHGFTVASLEGHHHVDLAVPHRTQLSTCSTSLAPARPAPPRGREVSDASTPRGAQRSQGPSRHALLDRAWSESNPATRTARPWPAGFTFHFRDAVGLL